MIPVKINDYGRVVVFPSKQMFLKVLHKHFAFMTTAHFKEKYGPITLQELWDKLDGHECLEEFRRSYTPYRDEAGIEHYRKFRIRILPIELSLALNGERAEPAPVASDHVNGSAPAAPVPISAEEQLTAIRILDVLDNLFLECGLAEGTEAAKAFKASITGIHIEQRRVEFVNGDPDHWLVSHLNSTLGAQPGP